MKRMESDGRRNEDGKQRYQKVGQDSRGGGGGRRRKPIATVRVARTELDVPADHGLQLAGLGEQVRAGELPAPVELKEN